MFYEVYYKNIILFLIIISSEIYRNFVEDIFEIVSENII